MRGCRIRAALQDPIPVRGREDAIATFSIRDNDGQRLAIILALAANASILLFFLSAFLVVDPDLFHEMALARAALQRGGMPTRDLFAFTPTIFPSVHHEWGTGMVLYWIVTRFGAAGLLALKYLLGFSVAFLTARAARRLGAAWEVLCLLSPLALMMADIGFTTVRAQFFTLLFAAALLVLLQRDREGRRLWVVPWLLLHTVWLNLHGGFVVGPLLLGCHWLEQVLRSRKAQWHLIACGMAMLALVPVNPYGLDYARYLGGALTMSRPANPEWRPVWASPSLAVLFGLSLLVAAHAWRRGGSRQPPGWIAVVVFALAALLHVRHLSIYAVVWAAFVPAWAGATPAGEAIRSFWKGNRQLVMATSLVVMVLGVGASLAFQPWRLRVPVSREDLERGPMIAYPSGAVRYLRERKFEGNVMTPFVEGSYVSWELYPAVKVGLDGRYEVAYRPGVAEEILAFYAGQPGWDRTLRRYPADLVLVRATDPVGSLLAERSGWGRVYQDDAFELFARPGIVLPHVDLRGKPIEPLFP